MAPSRPLVAALLVAAIGPLVLGACRRGDGGGSTEGSSGDPSEAPDVVLIVLDDWAQSDLESARSDANPWNDLLAIDALASQGQSWNHFYAQPICNPTRVTLLLGRYEGGDGGGECNPPNARTPDGASSIATTLAAQGYTTAAFGKWHVATHPDPTKSWNDAPAAWGFDHWRAWNASNLGGHCGSTDYEDWQRVDDGVAFASTEYHTEAVGLAFLDWWNATDGPRFAYVCFQAPHQPFHAPPARLLPSGMPTPTTAREQYEAMLVATDTMIATILAAVDLDTTYVLLFGDNGTPPAGIRDDQSASRAKKTVYEDGVNVPLIVAGPGIAGGATDALGHVVDLPATLAALVGTTSPGGASDSVSLLPVFEDGAARVRDHVICDVELSETNPANDIREICVVLDTPDGLVKGRFYEDTLRMASTKTYYELRSDPTEATRLSPQDPVLADEIAAVRALWRDYLDRP